MAARDAIATAVTAVTAIGTCSQHYRQTTTPGEAMVRLDNLARDDSGFGFMATWQVVVVLPQDLVAAETWIDTNVNELVAAVAPHLIVTAIRPADLIFDTGAKVPALVIEGTREHD